MPVMWCATPAVPFWSYARKPPSGGGLAGVTSLSLDIGVLDHLLPVAELRLDEVAECLGRAGKALEADILEFCLNVRTVDDFAQRAIELCHDVRRRPGGRDQTGPGVQLEAGYAGL